MNKSETHFFVVVVVIASLSENDAFALLFLFVFSIILFLLLIFFISTKGFANLNISIRFTSILFLDLAVKDIHGIVRVVDQLATRRTAMTL